MAAVAIENEWHRVLDEIELLPAGITLSLSVGRKSILLFYMLLSAGVSFDVFMVSVDNRQSSLVNSYQNKIITILNDLGIVFDVRNIMCNGIVDGWCPRIRCASDYRTNQPNIQLSGWNLSSDCKYKNVLYLFFGLSDEIVYSMYNEYVPNVLRPLEHIEMQCDCPYGKRK